jgi:hypothetical protein
MLCDGVAVLCDIVAMLVPGLALPIGRLQMRINPPLAIHVRTRRLRRLLALVVVGHGVAELSLQPSQRRTHFIVLPIGGL